ncbi:MAG: alpha/beta fold hydrolase [Defluviitaleaceae bacterium]|nr:alpha/beta fold hydrolase [Defluviitaleaceae bacterium]
MFKKQIFCFVVVVALAFGFVIGAGAQAANENVHVVQAGDVLWRIAYAHDTTWEVLAEYNGLTNPHLIFPGQVIRIPSGQGQPEVYEPAPPEVYEPFQPDAYDDLRVHVVQAGESLASIARMYYYGEDLILVVQAILEYNNMADDSAIFVGQVLLIPEIQFVTPDVEIHAAPFLTESIVVGAETSWPLGGYLTIPHEASAARPVPGVVLVHGSGPGDRNQTVFANRPFYDIAAYLSANGVAVLRYDKRTLTHGLEVMQAYGSSLTVWEETIEDAILAAELLRQDPRIGDVFVAGLSLGGMLAPRIHASGGDFDGIIILAGSPRNLTDIMIDQNWLSLEASLGMQGLFEERIATLQDLLGDLDTSAFASASWEDITLEYLYGYADIIREWFGLPETISDRDTMWYLLDLMIDGGRGNGFDSWQDAWQYFYEAGNTAILHNLLGIGPEVTFHELSSITIVNIAAGEPEAALAFLLDYIVTAMQAELAVMSFQLAELEAMPAQIEELAEFFASFPYMTEEEAKATEIVPGSFMFAYYFRDMMLNPAPYFLQQAAVPMLIMHGDNDLQVYTEADFNLFKELLAGRDNVSFRLFDGLNHLFMPSVATNLIEMLAEYEIPSQVDAQVLRDMLDWILAHTGSH